MGGRNEYSLQVVVQDPNAYLYASMAPAPIQTITKRSPRWSNYQLPLTPPVPAGADPVTIYGGPASL